MPGGGSVGEPKRGFLLWSCLFALSTSVGCGSSDKPFEPAQTEPSDPRIAEFVANAGASLRADGVVGAAIGLVLDGKLAYAGGFGARSVGGPAVDGDTLFLVGSITKMLTSATVMSLVEEGKLDPDASITTYLPHLRVNQPFDVQELTLSGLLSHSDGLEDTRPAECELQRFSDYGGTEPLTLFGPPHTFFAYSNNDSVLAAQAIESVLGPASFERAVRERVFVPAEMTSATFDAAAATQSDNVATGYFADATGAFTQPATIAKTYADCPIYEPAGYAIASARDFGKFIETLLADGKTMLSARSVARMETGVLPTGYNPNYQETYGYGLYVDQIGGQTTIDHSGDIAPFHSAVFFVPAAKAGIVVLINSESPKTIGKIVQSALAQFAPPPMAVPPRVKTKPTEWQAYEGTYVDSYGQLGTFSLAVQGNGLKVTRDDGSLLGTLIQDNGDHWILVPSSDGAPSIDGVFMRDDSGRVLQVVTRAGVAVRTDAGD